MRPRIVDAEIPVREVAVRTGRGRDHAEFVGLAVKAVAEGRQVFTVAIAADIGLAETTGAEGWVHNLVRCVAVSAYRSGFVPCSPANAMGAVGLPGFQQQAVALAAHFRCVNRRGQRIRVGCDGDVVTTVAVIARSGFRQARMEQAVPVNTGDVAVDQGFGIVMAAAAGLNLADRRHR